MQRFATLQTEENKREWIIYSGAYFVKLEHFQDYVMTALANKKKPSTATFIQHWSKV